MSLEARVAALEESRVHWDQVLTGVEGTVGLILNEQREKFREVDEQFRKVKEQFKQQNQRLDKMEELLIQIVNHLSK